MWLLAVLASPLAGRAAGAQLAPGTLLEDGRVVVKVFVTMPEPNVSSGRPIPDVSLLVITEQGDRTPLTTDAAGTALTFLRPGRYRIVSVNPVEWLGVRYRWDLPITVVPGQPITDLTPRNAASSERVGRGASPAGSAARSPGTAQLLGALLPGAGHLYAGEPATGVGLLLAGAAAGALTASAVHNDDDKATAAFVAAGAAVWLTSVLTADDAARRWNRRHGLAVRPLLAPGAGRSLRVGLLLRR